MLRVISQGKGTAMVTVQDLPLIKNMTLHLKQVEGTKYRDHFGVDYYLGDDDVDWSVFYRERLLNVIRHGDPNANYKLATRMAHYIPGKVPQADQTPYQKALDVQLAAVGGYDIVQNPIEVQLFAADGTEVPLPALQEAAQALQDDYDHQHAIATAENEGMTA
jgi:hypothetical protein